jgi:hypothetical protein
MAAANDIGGASLDELVQRRLRAAGTASRTGTASGAGTTSETGTTSGIGRASGTGTTSAGAASVMGAASAIGRADRGQPLPLSAGQQQMWILHLLAPKSPAYLMTWTLRLTGRLDREAMRRAWERVVERHEILRTRYSAEGGQPVQIRTLRTACGGRER